jgi:hypothetical protein
LSRRNASSREFQLKESSRYKKIEEKSVEGKISGMSHGSREAGRQTRSRSVKIKCALRVIQAAKTLEKLLQNVVVISETNKSTPLLGRANMLLLLLFKAQKSIFLFRCYFFSLCDELEPLIPKNFRINLKL